MHEFTDRHGLPEEDGTVADIEPVHPPEGLEDRVVGALYAEGLLGTARSRMRLPRGADPRATFGHGRGLRTWWPLATAASVALFAAGFAAGQMTGARSTAEALISAREADAAATAALVQQAGTAYVQAIAALADRTERGDADEATGQGEAAAVAAFTAAAEEWARLDPDDATARQVLSLLATERGGDEPREAEQTLWF